VDLIAVGEVLVDVSAPALVAGRAVHAPVRLRAGGTPVNAALAARSLGATVTVVGRVGDDFAAGAIRSALEAAGIEAALAADPEAATGTFVEAGEGAAKAVVTDRGASARLAPGDVPERLTAGAVLVSGYALLQEDTAPAAGAAIVRADAPWVAVSLAAPRLIERLGRRDIDARAAGANVLLANAEEAGALTGLGPDDAAADLARRYELACVTKGGEGAVAATGSRVERVDATGRDVTGAGDAFAGALLVALGRGADLRDALATARDAAATA
jgi:sugar/nucleoside kinase (ribokinase family)